MGLNLSFDFHWWQLWTAHLWHWDARHLLLNLAALLPLLALLRARRLLQLLAAAVIAAPLLSLFVLACRFDGEYRGASGLVVGLWFAGGVVLLRDGQRLSGMIVLAGITAKLIAEQAGLWPAASPSFETMPLIHYAGALVGIATAGLLESRAPVTICEWTRALPESTRVA